MPTISLAACIDSVGGHSARESLIRVEDRASACAHPTRPCITFSQRKSAPVSALGQGIALISLFRLPRNRGGWRADRAQCPDYSGRVVRITPDDEVHLRCTPRLAARQRGILAFMPLTVVGPGRLLVADEAARVRPGDEDCVSLRSQVPRPFPAYRTPPEGAPQRVDRDGLSILTLKVKSSSFFTTGALLKGE